MKKLITVSLMVAALGAGVAFGQGNTLSYSASNQYGTGKTQYQLSISLIGGQGGTVLQTLNPLTPGHYSKSEALNFTVPTAVNVQLTIGTVGGMPDALDTQSNTVFCYTQTVNLVEGHNNLEMIPARVSTGTGQLTLAGWNNGPC